MKKRLLALVLTGIMVIASLTGCKSVKTVDSEEVLMTVNGEEVTAGVANFYARYTQAQYESFYGAYMGDSMWSTEAEEGVTYEEYVKDEILKMVQIMVLGKQHAADYGVELTDDETALVEKAVKEFSDANAQENKEKVSGDEATVEQMMILFALNQKMQDAIYASVDQEVSDDEAAQKKMEYVFFSYETTDEEGNTVELTDDEKATLKTNAEGLQKAVKDGESMATAAGLLEVEMKELTFDAESIALDSTAIEAADALAEGEVSDVIETETGVYVMKVVSLLDREATDAEKELIVNERQSAEYEAVCAKWLEEAEIEVNEDVWAKVDFDQLSVTMKMEETDAYADEVVTDDVAE